MSELRKGMRPSIATRSGKEVSFPVPLLDNIVLEDLAEGLAKCCRYAGQCSGWWSVARHQVFGSYYAESPLQFLFHDASEGYMGDLATPLKRIIPSWKPLENAVLNTILRRFDVPRLPVSSDEDDPLFKDTHEVDDWMYVQEWHALMSDKIDWHDPGPAEPDIVKAIQYQSCSNWAADKLLWLNRYWELR